MLTQRGALKVVLKEPKLVSRSEKSVGKRDAIIRAAIEIINEKSYALATMTEIAASLKLRDAALYYYFPNKQALIYACHVQSLERFERLLDEAKLSGRTGASRLEEFIYRMLDDSHRNGAQLYFGDHSYLDDGPRDTIDRWAARLTETLERFLKEGIEDGSVVPCETQLVVQLFLGMLIWLAKWAPSIDGLTVDRLMNAIGAFSLHGLQKRDGAHGYIELSSTRSSKSSQN